MLLLFILLSWVFLKLPNGQGKDMSRNRSLRHPWQTWPFALEGRGLRHRPRFSCSRRPHKVPQEPRSLRGTRGTGVLIPTPTPALHRASVCRSWIILPSCRATRSCLYPTRWQRSIPRPGCAGRGCSVGHAAGRGVWKEFGCLEAQDEFFAKISEKKKNIKESLPTLPKEGEKRRRWVVQVTKAEAKRLTRSLDTELCTSYFHAAVPLACPKEGSKPHWRAPKRGQNCTGCSDGTHAPRRVAEDKPLSQRACKSWAPLFPPRCSRGDVELGASSPPPPCLAPAEWEPGGKP